MNINPTTCTFRCRTVQFSVPTKNKAEKMLFEVTGSLDKKITNISYYTLNETLAQKSEPTVFQNKKGFTEDRLKEIYNTIQEKLQEGKDFLIELYNAQFPKNN